MNRSFSLLFILILVVLSSSAEAFDFLDDFGSMVSYQLSPLSYEYMQNSANVYTQEQSPLSLDNIKGILEYENEKFLAYTIGIDPETELPYNYIVYREPFNPESPSVNVGEFSNPTDIGLYIATLVSIACGDIKSGLVSQDDALFRLERTLDKLSEESVPEWNGLLYWYNLASGKIEKDDKAGYISCFDNAFYSAALACLVGAFDDVVLANPYMDGVRASVVDMAKSLLDEQRVGWSKLYDKKTGLLFQGYPLYDPRIASRHIDRIYSEGRLAVLMAYALYNGEEDRSSMWKGLREFTTEYTLSNGNKINILAPWEGAFQAWVPQVFVPEAEWSPDGFKIAHQNYAEVQFDYSQNNPDNLPGIFSECSNPQPSDNLDYQYITGLSVPGASESQILGNPIRSDISSLYGVSLLYMINPEKAVAVFNSMLARNPEIRNGPWGWRDSLNVNGVVSNAYVSKDQFFLLLGLNSANLGRYFQNFLAKEGKLEEIKQLYQEKVFSLK